jgi:hypothetical protein
MYIYIYIYIYIYMRHTHPDRHGRRDPHCQSQYFFRWDPWFASIAGHRIRRAFAWRRSWPWLPVRTFVSIRCIEKFKLYIYIYIYIYIYLKVHFHKTRTDRQTYRHAHRSRQLFPGDRLPRKATRLMVKRWDTHTYIHTYTHLVWRSIYGAGCSFLHEYSWYVGWIQAFQHAFGRVISSYKNQPCSQVLWLCMCVCMYVCMYVCMCTQYTCVFGLEYTAVRYHT